MEDCKVIAITNQKGGVGNTTTATKAVPSAVIELIFAAFYPKYFSVDQRLGNFFLDSS